jgi:disulfide bond formation protein DsbB
MNLIARGRTLLQPLPAAALVLAGAAVTLAGAWTFQAFGFEPCELCLKQRYPYYAALPLAAAAIFLARNAPPLAAKIVLGLLAAIFLASAAAGLYHAGVEWKWWPGPTDCTGDFVKPASMEAFRQQLQNVHLIRCDDVQLRILGLSLAGWNVLVSAGIAVVAFLGATAPNKA